MLTPREKVFPLKQTRKEGGGGGAGGGKMLTDLAPRAMRSHLAFKAGASVSRPL